MSNPSNSLFALLEKSCRREFPFANDLIITLSRVLDMSHVYDLHVGNDFIRGVSDGDGKRVSILETLTTSASITAWDNSTRDLDTSTAVE